MTLIIVLIIGGLVGWVAGFVIHDRRTETTMINAGYGVIGALLGSWLLASIFRWASFLSPSADPRTLLAALLGAVIVVAARRMIRRG